MRSKGSRHRPETHPKPSKLAGLGRASGKKNEIRASSDSRSCNPGVSNSITNISFRKRMKMSSFPTTFLLDCLALLNTWHWKSGSDFICFVIGLINVAGSLCLNLYYLVGKPPVRLENHSFGWKTNRTRVWRGSGRRHVSSALPHKGNAGDVHP